MRNPYILRIFVTSLLLMLMYLFLVLFFNFPMPEFYNNWAKSMAEAKSKPYIDLANSNHTIYISNEHVKNYPACPQAEIKDHIEWDDYINVLGHWKNKPNWKEILKAYRTQNTKELVTSKEINWE